MGETPLIVTGAGGRIGRLLRHPAIAPEFVRFSTTWCAHAPAQGVTGWDMLGAQVPDLPKGGILLHLAATLPGSVPPRALPENVAMAHALVAADKAARFAHIVHLSTVAVYAPQAVALREEVAPAPLSDYGRAKLEAEEVLRAGFGARLTILRLANLAGADALLGGAGRQGAVALDPVPGQPAGPVRSYIGPVTLGRALGHLLGQIALGRPLPPLLNLAQPRAVAMGDLLTAAGLRWHFGPHRPGTIARVEVEVARLMQIFPLPDLDPAALMAELALLRGVWP